jgi:hypothetical protein
MTRCTRCALQKVESRTCGRGGIFCIMVAPLHPPPHPLTTLCHIMPPKAPPYLIPSCGPRSGDYPNASMSTRLASFGDQRTLQYFTFLSTPSIPP